MEGTSGRGLKIQLTHLGKAGFFTQSFDSLEDKPVWLFVLQRTLSGISSRLHRARFRKGLFACRAQGSLSTEVLELAIDRCWVIIPKGF